jgi:membrane protease YdiL (CAAX protease family)
MKPLTIDKSALKPSSLTLLALPLIGMPVYYWIAGSRLFKTLPLIQRGMIGSLVTLGLALSVILIVLKWEKKPWAALGIRRQTRRTIIFALSASIVIAIGATLLSLLLIKAFALPMPTLLTESILRYPLWFSIWVVITNSMAEEVLFRGVILERLGQLTGSIWIGGLITLIWFTALHLPLGLVYVLTIGMPVSVLITVLYCWRRDLIATMIVHFVFNAPIIAASLLFAIAQN